MDGHGPTEYEAVIGLEVHAQLLTQSKIFCGCPTAFGAKPNSQTCPVCLGMPGTLPVLNKRAVEFAVKMALATGCTISHISEFERKNYFYPDLPKGYQITQYEYPLAENGAIEIEVCGNRKRVGITRIHLEEDAGKSLHESDRTLLDFNRCGVPLIEIVSEPALRSSDEAVDYLKRLRDILLYLGISDGNMEEGSLRCDANLSLRPAGDDVLGVRTEIKNMNSFKGVHRAISYEVERQKEVLKCGKTVVQETRLWQESEEKTVSMRGKEESSDYRYFPEPDLSPVILEKEWIECIRKDIPELPDEKKNRFMKQHGLSSDKAAILTASRAMADYFESCMKVSDDAKMVANWIINELLRELKRDKKGINESPLTPENLGKMVLRIKNGSITGRMAKSIFMQMYEKGIDMETLGDSTGKQILDKGEIRKFVHEVIMAYPGEVGEYQAGKERILTFFVGEVIKKSGGKANPKLVHEILKEKLQEYPGKKGG
jgi:aspartyl-tRNA(Asn)/glutamyl-tRNA(Gln) amidotransferase subunit B